MGTNQAPGHIPPQTLFLFPPLAPLPSRWSCARVPLCTFSLVYRAVSPRPAGRIHFRAVASSRCRVGGGLYQLLDRKALFCGLKFSVRVKRNTTFSRIFKRRLVPAKRAGVEHTIRSLFFSNDNRQVHFLLSTHRAAFPPARLPACLGWGQPHLVCDEYRIILRGVDQ